jgi:hypothetical protein
VTGEDIQIGIKHLAGILGTLTGLSGKIVIKIINQKTNIKAL